MTRILYATEAQSLVEHELVGRGLGSPLHTHSGEDEVSYVIAGRLGAQIGDDVVEATPGDVVVKPRGVPHAFWNPDDTPVRLLELITPGGFEAYFAEVEPILGAAGPPNLEALGAVAGRYGLEMRPESISSLVARHGLRPGAPPQDGAAL